jgi:hypothetical protein
MRTILILSDLLGSCATPPEPRVLDAARSYVEYGRVDDEARWAPHLCREPMKPQLRMSASGDTATHGRKQYYLYAKDPRAYIRARHIDQPEGQVIVKESWFPGAAKTKGPLFLMLKSGGDWVDATATPDGREVTASGKIASCIECHESASTRDRMFGLASSDEPK